ncbi:MAG: hypothetical protein JKY48_20265 [Flavobacteriales bacterium]|nr:hypothetical protein [Flavobacteriales bacterium]
MWNIVSFLFLLNIFVNVVLSSPTILQQFAFDQPSIALMMFPFILIPTILVPIVVVSNLAAFGILSRK